MQYQYQQQFSDLDSQFDPITFKYLYSELVKLIHDQNYERGRQPQTKYSKYYYEFIQHLGFQQKQLFGNNIIKFREKIQYQKMISQRWRQRLASMNPQQMQKRREYWTEYVITTRQKIKFMNLWMILKPINFIYACEQKRRSEQFKSKKVIITHKKIIIYACQSLKRVGAVQGMPKFIAQKLFPDAEFIKANHYIYHDKMNDLIQAYETLFPDFQAQIQNFQIVYKFPVFANLTEQELFIFGREVIRKMEKQTGFQFRCSFSASFTACKILIDHSQDNQKNIFILKKQEHINSYLNESSIHYLSMIQEHLGQFLNTFGIYKIQDLIDKAQILEIILGNSITKSILLEALGQSQQLFEQPPQDPNEQKLMQALYEIFQRNGKTGYHSFEDIESKGDIRHYYNKKRPISKVKPKGKKNQASSYLGPNSYYSKDSTNKSNGKSGHFQDQLFWKNNNGQLQQIEQVQEQSSSAYSSQNDNIQEKQK